jgi:hypothetical protein
MAARSGTSPSRYRVGILFAVGLVLLGAPAIVGWFDLADPDHYRYEAERVEFTDDGYRIQGPVDVIDRDAACLQMPPSRVCLLERAIHENGGLTFDGLQREFLDARYRYVYGDGQFYRTVATETDEGTVRYDLRPVSEREALAAISTDEERASSPIKRAIRTGSVTTSDELAGANELVATDDGYYVVYAAEWHEEAGERDPLLVAGAWIAAAFGLWLLLHAQRRRVERGA